MSDEVQDVAAQPVSSQPETAAPSLTIADLTLALQTIQAMAQRGAVKVEEMSTVGGLYDRLFRFLEAQGAVTRTPTNPTTPTQGENNA